MRTPGSDGFNNRGNAARAKLTREGVENIREEWSRKQELRRVAGEMEDRIDALQKQARDLRKQVKEAMTEQAKITHTRLAKQYDVSTHTIQSVISENSWPEY